MECTEALPKIHDYLDGTLNGEAKINLKKHLISCPDCNARFKEIERTEAMVRSMPRVAAPDGLVDRIMQGLPQPRKRSSWTQWFRRHPAASVASVFLAVMLSSFFTMWNADNDLTVKGASLDQLVFQGDTVVVPPGHTVNGNLTVTNGKLEVDGEINGNVVVIDGSLNMASTAKISGKISKIDQALEWLWYKVNGVFQGLSI